MDLALSEESNKIATSVLPLSVAQGIEYHLQRMREADWAIGDVEMRSNSSIAFTKNPSYERLLDVESSVFNCFLFIAQQYKDGNASPEFQFLSQVYLGVSKHLQSCMVECLGPVVRQVRRVAQLLDVSISKNQVGIVAYDGLLGEFCTHSVSDIEELVARAEERWTSCRQIYLTTEELEQMMQVVLESVLHNMEKLERVDVTVEHAKVNALKATAQAENAFERHVKRDRCQLKSSIIGVITSAGIGTLLTLAAKVAYTLAVRYITKK